jgi:hypothetical protein
MQAAMEKRSIIRENGQLKLVDQASANVKAKHFAAPLLDRWFSRTNGKAEYAHPPTFGMSDAPTILITNWRRRKMGRFRRLVDRAANWLGFGVDQEGAAAQEPSWLTSIDWFRASIGASLLFTAIRWIDDQFYILAGYPEVWLWHYLPVTFSAGCIHLLVQLDKLDIDERIKRWFVPTAIGLGALLLYKESLNIVLYAIYYLFPN